MPFLPHGKWNISATAGSFDLISDRKWSWECALQNYECGLLLILAIWTSNCWKTAQNAVFAPRKMEYLRNRLEFWLDFWLKMKLRMCSTKLWMWAVAHLAIWTSKSWKTAQRATRGQPDRFYWPHCPLTTKKIFLPSTCMGKGCFASRIFFLIDAFTQHY